MKLEGRTLRTFAATLLTLGVFTACGDDDPPSGNNSVDPPSGLTVTATSATTTRVTFTAVSGASSYIVQRASGAGAFATVGTPAGTTFDDVGLDPNTQYRYQVATVEGSRTSAFTAPVTVTTSASGRFAATLSAPITASRTLFADSVYTIQGYVRIASGATLTIQPGTRILGDFNTPGSSLFVTRGAKIVAIGTAANPIVFTSSQPVGSRKPGDWGGLVIVGNARINRNSAGTSIFTEGPTTARQDYANGTDDNDNSGTLRYVRIEFAGYAETTNEELNSLSMYAVGRGTTIEYVQTMAGLDDSFEWFGGTVDGRYLVSYESGDDHFDWTEGYRGRNQFLIAFQSQQIPQRAGAGSLSTDPNGFEGDGCENTRPFCTTFAGSVPFSNPVFANFTVVGFGSAFTTSSGGYGAVIRRGAGVTLINGILARWPRTAINIRDLATDTLRQRDSVTIRNVLLVENGANFDAPGGSNVFGQQANFASNNIVEASGTAASLFVSLTPPGLDWTPSAASAARTGGLATFTGSVAARVSGLFGGTSGIVGTSYVGAVDPAGPKWYEGWTVYVIN
ncbi:MAG: fibronectin type III domain-containing protein [Anaerolineae bacterium]|nr:fibronectin type III domain-containing protein [Gemmatimonadaceae bacterium]